MVNNPLNATDPSGKIVIIIHGIYSDATPWDAEVKKGLDTGWAAQGKPIQPVFKFVWTSDRLFGLIKNRRPGVFDAVRTVNTKDKDIIKAALTLASFATKLRKALDDCGAKDEKINILAHSLGTIVALRALQEGAPLDNLVLLGSPLLPSNARREIPPLAGKLRKGGKIFNYYSRNDLIVGPIGAARPWWETSNPPSNVQEIDDTQTVGNHSEYHTEIAARDLYSKDLVSDFKIDPTNKKLIGAINAVVGKFSSNVSEVQ